MKRIAIILAVGIVVITATIVVRNTLRPAASSPAPNPKPPPPQPEGGRLARFGKPTTSPSGRFTLKLIKTSKSFNDNTGQWPYIHFQILDQEGKLVYEQGGEFAAWFSLQVAWDAQDRVWVRSGDVGVSYWYLGQKGWARQRWDAYGRIQPPTVITIDRIDRKLHRY